MTWQIKKQLYCKTVVRNFVHIPSTFQEKNAEINEAVSRDILQNVNHIILP